MRTRLLGEVDDVAFAYLHKPCITCLEVQCAVFATQHCNRTSMKQKVEVARMYATITQRAFIISKDAKEPL